MCQIQILALFAECPSSWPIVVNAISQSDFLQTLHQSPLGHNNELIKLWRSMVTAASAFMNVTPQECFYRIWYIGPLKCKVIWPCILWTRYHKSTFGSNSLEVKGQGHCKLKSCENNMSGMRECFKIWHNHMPAWTDLNLWVKGHCNIT